MTQKEELKKLCLEDFQAPHQVLCYGAGTMGIEWASSYLRMGIHVVGFIDKYKTGTLNVPGGELPIYSIREAAQRFGSTLRVIITVSNAKLFGAITADLREAGIEEIFNYDVLNWITVPSEKRYCYDLFHSVVLIAGGLTRCCKYGIQRVFIPEISSGGGVY